MQIAAEYQYHIPSTLEEAAGLVLDGGMVMAGGSDLMPRLKMAVARPDSLVDLSRVPGLDGIREAEDGIHIGAMTKLSKISLDETVLSKAPILSQAARNVASPQIRNRGTIGGNLLQARRCFYFNQTAEWRQGIPVCRKLGGDICIQMQKSPVCRAIYYSDMAPALIACKADARILTVEGERTIPVEELCSLHCADRLKGTLLLEVIVPRSAYEGSYAAFRKYSLRGSIDFPIINFACVLAADSSVRFTAGAIAPRVLRLGDVEEYIASHRQGFDAEEAAAIAVGEMTARAELIREAGISISVKRDSFRQVRAILADLKSALDA